MARVFREMQDVRKITPKRIYLAMCQAGEYFSAWSRPDHCEKNRGWLDSPSDNALGGGAEGALPSLCPFSTPSNKPPASREALYHLGVNSVIQGADDGEAVLFRSFTRYSSGFLLWTRTEVSTKHIHVWFPFLPTCLSHLPLPRTHIVASLLRVADLAQVLSHLKLVSHRSPGRQSPPYFLLSPPTWTPRFWPTAGTCVLGVCSLSALSLTPTGFPKHTPVVSLAVTGCPRAASHFTSLKGTFANIYPSHWILLLEQ